MKVLRAAGLEDYSCACATPVDNEGTSSAERRDSQSTWGFLASVFGVGCCSLAGEMGPNEGSGLVTVDAEPVLQVQTQVHVQAFSQEGYTPRLKPKVNMLLDSRTQGCEDDLQEETRQRIDKIDIDNVISGMLPSAVVELSDSLLPQTGGGECRTVGDTGTLPRSWQYKSGAPCSVPSARTPPRARTPRLNTSLRNDPRFDWDDIVHQWLFVRGGCYAGGIADSATGVFFATAPLDSSAGWTHLYGVGKGLHYEGESILTALRQADDTLTVGGQMFVVYDRRQPSLRPRLLARRCDATGAEEQITLLLESSRSVLVVGLCLKPELAKVEESVRSLVDYLFDSGV